MSVLPFVAYTDPRLRSKAQPVAVVDDAVRAIWVDMIDTMEAMPGVGLAAPQVGISRRLAVVDASDERGQAVAMANPVLLSVSAGLRAHEEASPNLPGVSARVRRPTEVRVGFLDHAGQPVERVFTGLWATSVQHQIDHLDGLLYIDRLSRTKRDMLLRKARKMAR